MPSLYRPAAHRILLCVKGVACTSRQVVAKLRIPRALYLVNASQRGPRGDGIHLTVIPEYERWHEPPLFGYLMEGPPSTSTFTPKRRK